MPRLRVLAGPALTSLVPISYIVNTDKPHTISSDHFEGQVVVNIKGFTGPHGRILDSEYFHRPDRKDITWSIQVQGRFLQYHSTDEILFGNIFDRPLKLPWGSGAALKFMSYVDPTLEHDLGSQTKPWALSPLISTMPHFSHARLRGSRPSSRSSSRASSRASSHSRHGSTESGYREERSRECYQHHLTVPGADKLHLPPFPPLKSMEDNLSQIHLVHSRNPYASDSSSGSELSLSSRSSSSSSLGEGIKTVAKVKRVAAKATSEEKHLPTVGPHSLNLHTAQQRKAYFHKAKHRKEVTFGPHDVLTMDFCHGFLEFNPSLTLRLPGGVSFDLMKYWDGQPIRFACCERKQGIFVHGRDDNTEDPWGRMFWCVQIELAEDEEDGSDDEEFHDAVGGHAY